MHIYDNTELWFFFSRKIGGEEYLRSFYFFFLKKRKALASSVRINYCLCEHTVREGGVEKAPCCDTVAVVGAGAERLTCSTVATSRGRRRVSPAVLSSHCCSMAAVLGLDG